MDESAITWWDTQHPLVLCVKLNWPPHLAFVSTSNLLEVEVEELRNAKSEVLRELHDNVI
jgi:hypothetical protein